MAWKQVGHPYLMNMAVTPIAKGGIVEAMPCHVTPWKAIWPRSKGGGALDGLVAHSAKTRQWGGNVDFQKLILRGKKIHSPCGY
jgi:hypothetical protein